MALVLQDRVSVNSTGSGTGDLVLGSAYPGFRTFASCIPTGSVVYYTISNQAIGSDTEWEVGYGTYVLSTNTLQRNTGNPATSSVYSSSNSNAYTNFTAGTNGLQVFITQPSEQAIYQDVDNITSFREGYISVVGANSTAPTFATTLSSFVSNVPSFSQLVAQNQSADANASSDIVAYNNLGDGTSYFVDMGINSSTYNSVDYPIFQANDAYLFNAGNIPGTGAAGDISRLLIGTSTANSNVVIFGGSVNVNAVIATFVASTKNVNFANNISVTSNASANNITLTNLAYAAGNVSAGANSTVLTTKAYVDSAVATGFTVHSPCVYATAAALPANTYNNGALGVGATLTAVANGALSVDGSAVTTSQRILVKDEVTQANNGVYTVTQTGSGILPYILTRATDFDTASAGEIANNAYVFVTAGATNINYSFVLSQLAAITVGTTALPFTLFANQLVYTGTAPINVTGQTISLTGIVPIANGGTNLSSYTTGDTVYASATNVLSKRPIGASNTVLVSNGSVPDWGTVALGSASAVSGTLGATNGGTGQTTYTLGDIIYSSGANTLAKLAGQITTTNKFLRQTGTGAASAAPVWNQVAAADISGLAPSATTDTANASNITSGTLANARTTAATANGASTIVLRDATGNFAGNTITGVTFSGSGASLTSLNGSNVTTGTVANARTTAVSTNTASAIVTRDISGNFAAGTITASLTGTASTATNIAGGAAGGVPYQTGSGATSILATGTGVLVGGTTPSYSATPTLTGTNFTGIPNAGLTNSSTTFNGVAVALGASGTITATTTQALTAGTGISFSSGTTFNGSAAITINSSVTSPIPAGSVMLFYQAVAPTGWTQVTTVALNDSALRIVTGSGGTTGGVSAFSTVFANQTPTGSVTTTNTAATATMASYTPAGSISVTVGAGTLAVGAGTFAVGATTLSTAQIPSHTHTTPVGASGPGNPLGASNVCFNTAGTASGAAGGGSSHTHGLTGAPSISGSPSVTAQSFTGTAATLTQNSHNHTATSSFAGSALTLNVKYVDIIICSKN